MWIHIYIYTYLNIYIHTWIYIFIYIYINKNIYIYKQICEAIGYTIALPGVAIHHDTQSPRCGSLLGIPLRKIVVLAFCWKLILTNFFGMVFPAMLLQNYVQLGNCCANKKGIWLLRLEDPQICWFIIILPKRCFFWGIHPVFIISHPHHT